jgi:hypothetical protein
LTHLDPVGPTKRKKRSRFKTAARILLVRPFARMFDLVEYLRGIWQLGVLRLHKQDLRETEGSLTNTAAKQFAVVALYPSDDTLPFTLNLLDALMAANLWILVVSAREVSAAHLAEIKARSHHLIERANIGQDFGSYQVGIRWLEQHRQLHSADVLILANDSMFYPEAFAAEVQMMFRKQSPWQSLFENFDHHYHAQSFFLLFRAAVLRSAAFWRFWTRYRPFPGRVHAIHRGEARLTQVLLRDGFVCDPAYSFRRLAEALANAPLSLAQLAELMPIDEHWDVSRGAVYRSLAAPTHGSARPDTGPRCPDTEDRLWRDWVPRIVDQFRSANPTQFAGLLCNRLFAAPLKRDICYRDIFAIDQTLREVTGFTEAEMAAMGRELQRRGLGSQLPLLRRVLYMEGRL